jgi:hypothetical protein
MAKPGLIFYEVWMPTYQSYLRLLEIISIEQFGTFISVRDKNERETKA